MTGDKRLMLYSLLKYGDWKGMMRQVRLMEALCLKARDSGLVMVVSLDAYRQSCFERRCPLELGLVLGNYLMPMGPAPSILRLLYFAIHALHHLQRKMLAGCLHINMFQQRAGCQLHVRGRWNLHSLSWGKKPSHF